jgi:hypothetical protein
MTALEMLNELIQKGFIVPVGDQTAHDFSMPTAYESVESITTYGSAPSEGDDNAELGSGS